MEIITLENVLFRLPKMPYNPIKNHGLIVKADGIKFIVSEDFTPIELSRMVLYADYKPSNQSKVKFENCNKDFIF
jgi:hypothetical protein